MFKRIANWLSANPRRRRVALVIAGLILFGVGYGCYRAVRLARDLTDPRTQNFLTWGTGGHEERRELVTTRQEACPGAPFILPAEGYVGLLYGDSRGPYSESHRHQGIDIFSPGESGRTPVYAAYDGYLTRETRWVSALIIRVPDDPLHPGRQIWLYYTHMAPESGEYDYIEDSFPPGTHEVFVEQGTFLGYTGDYSGDPLRSVWVHLHFSIVLDDGMGGYLNELEFDNTVDPSRYLGMPVNYGCATDAPAACTPDPLCADAVLGAGGG